MRLRKGWQKVALGSIATLLKERNGEEQFDRVMTMSAAHGLVDQARYFKKSVASANLSNYRVVRKGDFVYNKSTSRDAPMGVIVRWEGEEPVLVSPIYLVFRVFEGQGNIDYLSHYFRSIFFFSSLKGLLREGARAHGALNVRQEEFLGADLVLPPLREQQRIVDLMDSVDTAISTSQAEVDARVRLRERILEHELGTSGDRWDHTTLGGIESENGGSIQTGPFGSQLHKSDYTEYGTPVIMPTNIRQLRVDPNGIARVGKEHVDRLQRHVLQVGDIVYSRRGDVEKCALIGPNEEGWLCGTGCLLVRVAGATTNAEWLSHWLSTARVRAWVSAHSVGATMANLNTKILRNVPVRLPPLVEQQRLVEMMSSLDEPAHAAQAALENLRDLRSSMLTALLSGEHEIPETYDQFLTKTVEGWTG